MNRDQLIVRIFVIDPLDNREELDLGGELLRALLRSPAERKAHERLKRRRDEERGKQDTEK